MKDFNSNCGGGDGSSGGVVVDMGCDLSASVGDPVYQDVTEDNKAVKPASNNPTLPIVFGAIIEKPTPTTCKVMLTGSLQGLSGLTRSKVVYLSLTGGYTTTPPTTGSKQILGVASSSTGMFLIPNMTRVIKS